VRRMTSRFEMGIPNVWSLHKITQDRAVGAGNVAMRAEWRILVAEAADGGIDVRLGSGGADTWDGVVGMLVGNDVASWAGLARDDEMAITAYGPIRHQCTTGPTADTVSPHAPLTLLPSHAAAVLFNGRQDATTSISPPPPPPPPTRLAPPPARL
jgi:hypothetical protein